MANEARAHLFLKPSDDDQSTHEKATTDTPSTEIQLPQRLQDDDKHIEAVKPEHRCSPQRPLSRVDNKYKSEKVEDHPGMKRISNHRNVVMGDKPEVKQVYEAEPSTALSAQKLSRFLKSEKTDDKQRSHSVGRNESDVKSKIEKERKPGRSTGDRQQQLVVETPVAGNSETKRNRSSRNVHEKKVPDVEGRPSNKKLVDRKIKSVIVKSENKAETGLGGSSSAVHGNSCQKRSETRNGDKITRKVLRSFDEVHQIFLLSTVGVCHFLGMPHSKSPKFPYFSLCGCMVSCLVKHVNCGRTAG